MRKILRILFTITFFASICNGNGIDPIESLKDEISISIASTFGEGVRTQLSKTEMAPSDIDRIVQEFSDSSAACFVDSILRQAEEQSLDSEQILRKFDAAFREKSGEDLTSLLDEKGLELRIDVCIVLAFENAGVSLE